MCGVWPRRIRHQSVFASVAMAASNEASWDVAVDSGESDMPLDVGVPGVAEPAEPVETADDDGHCDSWDVVLETDFAACIVGDLDVAAAALPGVVVQQGAGEAELGEPTEAKGKRGRPKGTFGTAAVRAVIKETKAAELVALAKSISTGTAMHGY